ncbi:MAG: CarD family transcriptional regulator [Myxococcota bacterium]
MAQTAINPTFLPRFGGVFTAKRASHTPYPSSTAPPVTGAPNRFGERRVGLFVRARAKGVPMPSGDLNFKVGDKAIYPAQGVAEIVAIEEKSIGGSKQAFYILKLLDTERTMMVPVARAEQLGLRPPITEKDIQEIFMILKERTIAFDTQPWNRRFRGFTEKIGTGSVFDVAEVMRDLYCLRSEKSLSWGERKMLEKARNLIVKEIAVARRKDEEKIQAEIEALFDTADE